MLVTSRCKELLIKGRVANDTQIHYKPGRSVRRPGDQEIVRSLLSVAHRWAGLAIAAFLFVSGVTGAVVSWDHELDDLLNPHLMNAVTRGPARPSLDLAREIEARDPRIVVTDIPLVLEQGSRSPSGWQSPLPLPCSTQW